MSPILFLFIGLGLGFFVLPMMLGALGANAPAVDGGAA